MEHSGSLHDLRQANRDAVLELLRRHGPASRADLARRTGLARATVSSLVGQLIREGALEELAERGVPHKQGSGRPPALVSLTGGLPTVLGVDLGHRHVRLAVADGTGVLARRAQVFDVDHQAQSTLATVGRLTREALDEAGVALGDLVGVGMGVPGPIDKRTGRLQTAILPGWRDVAPGESLAELLGRPVVLENDANLCALGEWEYGAARGLDDVLFLKASDGLGLGLVLRGQIYRGASGAAGEIGHVLTAEDGPVCRCGSRGCLETLVSASKLAALLQPAHDEEVTVEAMLELAAAGDAGANRVLSDAGRTIGRVVAMLVTTLDPSAVVVGGSLGAASSLLEGVRDSVTRLAQPHTAAKLVVTAGELGEDAGALGAVALALDSFARQARAGRGA